MKPSIFHLFKNIIIIIQLILILIKESNSECITKAKESNNECLTEEYEFGDYCYNNCEICGLAGNNDITPKKCKCPSEKEYIIETKINGLKYYRCTDKCPSGYYEVGTNICVDECKEPNNKIINNNGCTDSCGISQVLFVKNLPNEETMNYCLDKCPDEAKFYKPSFIDQIKCITECPDKQFYKKTEKGYECSLDCDKQAKIDIDSKTFLCTNESKGICNDPSFPYEFEGSCLKNCKDTELLDYFGKKKTYFFYSKQSQRTVCSETCEEYNNENEKHKWYIVPNSLYCVEDCQKTNYKYHFSSFCLESCNKDNNNNINNNHPYIKYDTNECVPICSEDYHLLRDNNNICYKDPPIHSGKIYLSSDNEWNTCNPPDNPNYPNNGEGYFIKQSNECHSSCDFVSEEEVNIQYVYHKYGDNECLSLRSKDPIIGNAYKYGEISDKILYQSCNDIPDKEYIYEYEISSLESPYKYICQNSKGENDIYYNNSNVYKCLSSTDSDLKAEFCSKVGLYYLRGKECIKDCNSNEYKIPFERENGKIIKLGECSNKCPEENNKFFSEEEKVCYSQCNYKQLQVNLEDDQNNIPVFPTSNCVTKCPEDYPYEMTKNNKIYCLKNLPDSYYYYITEDGTKKCIDDCNKISKFIKGEECVDECKRIENGNPIYEYYYIKDGKKICISSCMNNENENENERKALKANDNHQQCIETCPDYYKYYYPQDNLCLNNCGNGFIDTDTEGKETNKCLTSCTGDNKYIIKGNICSKECTQEEPFQIKIPGSDIIKCTSNCINEDTNLIYYSININGEKYEYECLSFCTKKIFGNQCLDECPKGLYLESNKCMTNCTKPYFKKQFLSPEDKNNYYYLCVDTCDDDYISSTGECVEKCPLGENYIGAGNKCRSTCKGEDGEFYRELNPSGSSSTETEAQLIMYECINNCATNEYIIEGTKKCIKNCPSPYYSSPNGICYPLCLNDILYPFSAIDEHSKKICSTGCLKNSNFKYYGSDKRCVEKCSGSTYIINEEDNSCVSKCDIKSEFKYLCKETDNSSPPETKYYCKNTCNQKYSLSDFICTDICEKPNNYIIDNKICSVECKENQFAILSDNDEYICKDKCDSSTTFIYYYKKERICRENCKQGDYIIENTNECIESCNQILSNNTYYFYEPKDSSSQYKCVLKCPEEKPFVDIYNHCSESCPQYGYQYYLKSEKICLSNCPKGYKKNGFECVQNCLQSSNGNKYLDKNEECIESCLSSKVGYFYYYNSDLICIQKCHDNDFIYNDYECVSSCPNNYIYNKKCVSSCPKEQSYFIGIYEHGEIDLNKYCLTDCLSDYPFFTIEQDESRKCSGSCKDYYISNKDPNINAKQCVQNCENDYKFFVKHNNTHKECFQTCPSGKRYYIKSNEESNKECFEKCPSNYPYHNINSFECIEDCETKHATYDKKECVSNCEINDFWIKEESKDITLCVKNCTEIEYSRFYMPDRECVNQCDETKFLRGNIKKKICECMNLFYYNEEDNLECFDNTIKKCGEKGTIAENYTIQIYKENQCIQNCFGILSPSEDICYTNTENFECPENTEKGIYNGKIKCECKYRYYIDSNNKKICLNETEKCPSDYNYFIPDKKECTDNCNGYEIIFDNNCLNQCPGSMTKTDDKSCKCLKNWYKTNDDKYICLSKDEVCNNEYPYLIEDTKECVQKCNKTNYNILYDNKCISSCGDKMIRVEVEKDYPTYNISKYTCRCKNVWGEGVCSNTSDATCKDLGKSDLKYLVKKTKECVKNCPEYYKYYFNDECFSSCKEAKEYGYNVKNGTSNECICQVYFKIIENDTSNKIECIDECDDNEILIDDTKQCIKIKEEGEGKENIFKCPYNSPYLYNKKCYSICPEGTSIDHIKGNACKCNNLWITQENGLIYCLKEGEKCPYNTHPFLISETNECVKTKNDCRKNNPKLFNYTCYNKCPYLTKERNNIDNNNNNDNDNDCECNNNNYWYKYKNSSENNREYFKCGLTECPNKKPYINGTNECINKCGDENLYEYSNICYSDCPLFTEKNKNDYICEFPTESKNLENLVGNVTNVITDIYEDLPEGGLVINNEEASLQIYGLNKNNRNKKELIIRSNLAYIDLSGCIKKIYESNNMESVEDIVVVKLDLKSNNKKLIINPVEYEFINSKTGKVLDASVCEKNEVVISYPITYIFKKLRNLQDEDKNEEEIKKEILDKFNKGKELNLKDKSIDTFNFNSSIYSDICSPIQIDGKDLVLEDRIQYLFPNYSFCESICTYDYTDFEGERIYCNCSIKSGIDVQREHEIKIYQINKNETENNQKGPTNIPVLKCISKAKIVGNAAFYYCLIFIFIEIALLIVVIFYGISGLINKIKRKIIINKSGDKNNINNIVYNNSENDKIKEDKNDKTFKYNNDNNNDNISNSNTKRKMKSNEKKNKSNPPKNKNGDHMEDNEDEKDIEGVITIKKQKNKPIELKEKHIKIDEKNNFEDLSEYNGSEINKYLQKNGIETQMGFFQSMKQEEKLLRTKYNYSLQNDNFDSIIVVLTSVFDKIYIIKILLLPAKFDIIPLMFSLYLLCHMILLTFLTFFYDIKTIKKIYQNENYPNTNYYLLYGFIANIIVWIIFKLFCCLLNNEHKTKKISNINDKDKKNAKYNRTIYKIKRNIIIYFILQFLIILFCSFYLITFCGIYIGTKKLIFQSYGIAFVEIIIIKIIYGFILGILRKISIYKEYSTLYKIILIFNKYIS